MSIERVGGAGIDGLYLALMEAEQEQRKAHREIRHAAEDGQVDALMESADHIEDAAMWQAVGTAIQGATQIASGTLSIVGSLESLDAGNAARASGATEEAAAAAAKSTAQVWEGAAAAGAGVSKMVEAGTSYLAGIETADAKRSDAMAGAQESVAADARDAEQRSREVQQTLLRRLDQAEEARNASMAAVLRA